MKNILQKIAAPFVWLFKKVVKTADDAVVNLPQLPADVQITPELLDHIIATVNKVKDEVNNPLIVLLTDLTPISLDNEIRLKIANALPVLISGLTYSKELLEASTDKNALVNDLLAKVRFSDDPYKDSFYHTLAAHLITIVSDGKVTWSDAVSIVEPYFKQIFGQVLTDVVSNVAQPAKVVAAVSAVGTVAQQVANDATVVAGVADASQAPNISAVVADAGAVAQQVANAVPAVEAAISAPQPANIAAAASSVAQTVLNVVQDINAPAAPAQAANVINTIVSPTQAQ